MTEPTLTPSRICLTLAAAVLLTGAADRRPRAQATPSGTDSIDARLAGVQAALSSPSANQEESIRELKAILAVDPRRGEAHMLLGMAYRMQSAEMSSEARAELVQALELDPDLVPARFILAQLYLDLGRPGGARDTLSAGLAQHPGQPQLSTLLAEAERQLGNPQRALELTGQALQGDASLLQARYYRALALLDLEQRDAAILELEQVAAAGGNPPDTNSALGAAYLEAGRLDAAIAALGAALAADPARADARITLARAYRLRHQPERARAELARARAAKPAAAVAQDPLEPLLYMELGLLDLEQNRLTAAAASFRKVLDIDPANEIAARHLADVEQRLVRQRRPAAPGKRR